MRTLEATHPDDFARLDTEGLRSRFRVPGLIPDTPGIEFAAIGYERLLAGGVHCGASPIALEAPTELATAGFCDNRELLVVGIAGEATVTVDGSEHRIGPRDMLYVGRGTASVVFAGEGARLFLTSAPAHHAYPTRLVRLADAPLLERGASETSNERTVHQLVLPSTVDACQLTAGITVLAPGSVWNSFPSHLHARRTELYFYFELSPDGRVVHHLGPPAASRSMVLANEELAIAPPWSIHTGVGTEAYAFVWVMAGENRDYEDLVPVPVSDWR